MHFGTCYDRYVLELGRWRFAWRLFELEYRGPADLTGTFFDTRDYDPPPAMPPLDAAAQDHAEARWAITTD
jgi:hypothetical protein